MAGRIDVDPAGLVASISFTTMAGTAVTAYSDAGLSTPLTSPVSISNLSTFYLPGEGPYQVSVTLGGREIGPFIARSQGPIPGLVNIAHKLGDLTQDLLLSAALQSAAGGLNAGPSQVNTLFDIQAVGTTATDIPGASLSVVASGRPVLLTAKYELFAQTGTAANASVLTAAIFITDSANTILAIDEASFTQVGAANLQLSGKLYVELHLPAPVAAATYKVRAKCLAAVPTNWSQLRIVPGYGAIGAAANNNFRANTQ